MTKGEPKERQRRRLFKSKLFLAFPINPNYAHSVRSLRNEACTQYLNALSRFNTGQLEVCSRVRPVSDLQSFHLLSTS